jgi:AcrR family transcriptional regulator
MSVQPAAVHDVRERRTRRPQAERSAETRAKVLAAAVKSLHEHGYSGTTTMSIAKLAGVSMGGMQHQFPTKASLMAGVVEELGGQRAQTIRKALEGLADPRARLLAMHDVTWELACKPEFAAVLEISLARRSDPDLEREVAPAFAANEERYRRWVVGLGLKCGVRDIKKMQRARDISTGLMRGYVTDTAGAVPDPARSDTLDALRTASRAQLIAVLDER